MVAGQRSSGRYELVEKVAYELGLPASQWYLLGDSPLTPDLPEEVGGDFVAAGELFAVPPGWFARRHDVPRQVLVLRDLQPAEVDRADDRRLDDVLQLLESHTFAGYQLPAGVVIAVTVTPWPEQTERLNDFCDAAGLEYLEWPGAQSPDQFRRSLNSGDDLLAWADIPELVRRCDG